MNRHIDKHLVAAFSICAVIAASFGLGTLVLHRPTPQAEAATQSMIAQPYAEGGFTAWTGYPKNTQGYANIDETTLCNSSDYNYIPATATAGSASSTETYLTRLSTIPNTKIEPANDGTGNLIRTSYRILKIEVTPCLALHLPAPKTSNVDVFYRYSQTTSSKFIESSPTPYVVTSNLFQQQAPATWTPNHLKYSGSALEVGVRYAGGNGGARVSQLKVKVTYDMVVETISGSTVTKQFLPQNALSNTEQDLVKFQVAPSGTGTSYLKRMTFKLSKSAGVSLSQFRLYRGTSDIPLRDYTVTYGTTTRAGISVDSGSTGSGLANGYLVIVFRNPEAISGSGKTYSLRAVASGVTPGKYVSISYFGKTIVPPPDADKGVVPPPDADKGIVPPPDADIPNPGDIAWSETVTAN